MKYVQNIFLYFLYILFTLFQDPIGWVLTVPAWERLPTTKVVVDGRDGCDGVQTKLVVKEATHQAVNYGNFIIFAGKEKGSGPSTVAITTNSHDSLMLGGFIVYLVRLGPKLWSKLSI